VGPLIPTNSDPSVRGNNRGNPVGIVCGQPATIPELFRADTDAAVEPLDRLETR